MSLLLRLQLDIDGDVHPELYTLLASLPLESSQAERLRQLAATGLIWEQLRAQSRRRPAATPAVAAVSATATLVQVAPAAVHAAHPPPARAPHEVPVLREVVPAGELVRFRDALARRVAEGSAGVRRVLGAAVASDPLRAAAEARAVETFAAERNVAAFAERATERAAAPAAAPAAEPAAELDSSADAASAPPRERHAADTRTPPEAGHSPETAAPARTHGRRSRLMRMKEKGLFGAG